MIEYTVKVDNYGTKSWYLNGKQLTKKQHKKVTRKFLSLL